MCENGLHNMEVDIFAHDIHTRIFRVVFFSAALSLLCKKSMVKYGKGDNLWVKISKISCVSHTIMVQF